MKYICALLLALTTAAHAIVLSNPAAPGSTTSPTAEFDYWDNVLSFNGASGVYLGDGWVLTANHVGAPASLTIQGTARTVDPTSVQRINGADLKLFRITNYSDITLPSINTYTGWQYTEVLVTPEPSEFPPLLGFGGNSSEPYYEKTGIENGQIAYAIGYGAGAGTPVTGGYQWNSTYTKKWGLVTLGGENATVGGDSNTITSYFDRNLGDHAGAFALGDSGGGLFYEDASGWHLGGIMTNVSDSGVSYYDKYAGTPGDQPGYGISQRLANNNGLAVYRTTGIWALPNTTGAFNGSTWTEGNINSLRIQLTQTLNLSANASWGLLETFGNATVNTQGNTAAIGTVLTRGTNTVTLNGNFTIQALDGENDSHLIFKNGNTRIGSLSTQVPNVTLENEEFLIENYGGKIKTLTVNSSHITSNNLTVENLHILGQSTFSNPAPLTLTILGTGEQVTSYYNINVTGEIFIAEGATADTYGFRQANTADLNNAGNLFVKKDEISSADLFANKTTFEETSSLTLDLSSTSSDKINFLGEGTVNLFGTLNLNMLAAADPTGRSYTLFTYGENASVNLLFQNIEGNQIISQNGLWEFSLSTTQQTNNGITTYSIVANNGTSTVPEPTTLVLLAGAASCLLLHRRRK